MIKNNIIHKIMINERVSINLLIIGFLTSIFFIISISIYSKIHFASFTFDNFKNLMIYYEFPIKLIAVTLTLFGILVAYRTYYQTKDQFLILNSAWLKTQIIPELRPFEDDKQTKKLFILFEIENTGNTPAEDFEIIIDITTDQAELDIPQPENKPKFVYPHHAYTFLIEIGNTYNHCKEINEVKPIFNIDVNINYVTLSKIKFSIKEKYEYQYEKLIRLVNSDINKISL